MKRTYYFLTKKRTINNKIGYYKNSIYFKAELCHIADFLQHIGEKKRADGICIEDKIYIIH